MNWLLRIFGMQEDDWERIVIRTCSECGQPVCEERQVRPLTALEQAVSDFEADTISAEQLETRVAAALSAS